MLDQTYRSAISCLAEAAFAISIAAIFVALTKEQELPLGGNPPFGNSPLRPNCFLTATRAVDAQVGQESGFATWWHPASGKGHRSMEAYRSAIRRLP
jgi:hypothetical protein